MNRRQKATLILGSGFSKEFELPTTKELSDNFLETINGSVLDPRDEQKITEIIKTFWHEVFNYNDGHNKPLLEDHFTLLDLAANSGHNLGPHYTPQKLRAIRRMSIHRVFQILNQQYQPKTEIQRFLATMTDTFDLSIITLNWDIVVEEQLNNCNKSFTYIIETKRIDGSPQLDSGIPLLKMHGSANWLYCDSCRRIYCDIGTKTALHKKAYLEKEDFEIFDYELQSNVRDEYRKCRFCGNYLAGRVATFSYRKAFSIDQFQIIWNNAYKVLRDSEKWLFIGYSMPEADYEFKHLLKSSQLSNTERNLQEIVVVLKDDHEAQNRYQQFFGLSDSQIFQCGLEEYVNTRNL